MRFLGIKPNYARVFFARNRKAKINSSLGLYAQSCPKPGVAIIKATADTI